MKRNKWILIIVVLIVAGVLGYNYLYKNHRDISTEEASFAIKVETLAKDFKIDESNANAKYLDKTIEVSGVITAIDTVANIIIMDSVLSATLEGKWNNEVKVNETVSIKGRFIGYDELLEEFKMDQVTLIK